MVEVVYGGGNAAFDGSPVEQEEGITAPVVDRGRRGDRWNGVKGTEGRTPSGRKRGNQEKPKWVSSQVTWRRTGPNVQDGDTLSYSSSGLGRSRFCLPIQETPRDRENEMRSISPHRYPSRGEKEPLMKSPDENRSNINMTRAYSQLIKSR